MEFLPKPQKVQIREGEFEVGIGTCIVLQNTPPSGLLYAQMLRAQIHESCGIQLQILRGSARSGDICLAVDEGETAGHYNIEINENGLFLAAGDAEALCNGVQTACQMVQQVGASLPFASVQDFPTLANRGYYLDVSRGRVPTLEYLKQYADLLCRYKINQWQLYVEHTYLFRDFSEAWRDETPLTAEEILELDAYCTQRHIELVPSLASFGHMYKMLSSKTWAEFCELEDSESVPFSYTYSGWHHTLNVSHSGTLDFAKGLIAEYMQLFTSKKFNICADETFDLGKGRSKALAQQKSERELYIQHVKALCEFLVQQGRTPQFWGDIMWRFPEACNELPKETVCLNWGYVPNQREDEMSMIAKTGMTQYACPAVWGWNHLFPLLQNAHSNISVMCAHAQKFGAIGLLNTDWGDCGHINSPELSVAGILYGAAFSWNAEPWAFEEVNRTISILEYADNSGKIVSHMADLAEKDLFDWQTVVRWIENVDEAEKENREEVFGKLTSANCAKAETEINLALGQMRLCLRNMPPKKREIMQVVEVVAQGVKLWNEIGVFVATHRLGQGELAQENSALASKLEIWFHRYLQVWRTTSREGGVCHLGAVISAYADLLRGRHYKGKGETRGSSVL